MRKAIFLLCIMLSSLMLSFCMTTHTTVGTYTEQKKAGNQDYVYAKGKQLYLFWGLVPLGRTHVNTPNDGACRVRTYYGFWDALISVITGGIFEMQTIKVDAIKHKPATSVEGTAQATAAPQSATETSEGSAK